MKSSSSNKFQFPHSFTFFDVIILQLFLCVESFCPLSSSLVNSFTLTISRFLNCVFISFFICPSKAFPASPLVRFKAKLKRARKEERRRNEKKRHDDREYLWANEKSRNRPANVMNEERKNIRIEFAVKMKFLHALCVVPKQQQFYSNDFGRMATKYRKIQCLIQFHHSLSKWKERKRKQQII